MPQNLLIRCNRLCRSFNRPGYGYETQFMSKLVNNSASKANQAHIIDTINAVNFALHSISDYHK